MVALLKEKPMHGYELMKALSKRFSGFYAPKPGGLSTQPSRFSSTRAT